MGLDTALLLVAFGVAKVGIAAAILWLGLRSAERPDDDGGFGGGEPDETPPRLPARRARTRAPVRRGPARSPSRRPRGVRA